MGGDECLWWKVRAHEKNSCPQPGGNENGGRRGEKLNASMVVLMQDGQFHIR